jgi:hypothetical protein
MSNSPTIRKGFMLLLIAAIWLLCTSFSFKWIPHPLSDDDSYIVEFKPTHGGWRDWIKTNKVEGTKIYEVWIEPMTSFDCVRVRAINTVGQSAPSKWICKGE